MDPPLPVSLHLAPPSVLFHTPRPSVPAYRVEGCPRSIARDTTGMPLRPVPLQLVPPFVVLKTPLGVPAYSVSGSPGLIASASTELVKPVVFQVVPASVLL